MNGTYGALRLIELASTRLCHDISGLLGSLECALAASADGSAPGSNTGRTASGTAQALATRLDLRRCAWGPDGDPMSLAHIRHLARGLPEQISVDMSAMDQNAVLPAATGRIVLNLLLLAADSLPSGGTVVVAGEPDDLFVRISGQAAAWPTGTAVCLLDEAEARSALTDGRSLQMALTALLAHAAGIRLSVVLSGSSRNKPAILRLGG
jgi:histidine phosphotransferase ChpT